MSSFTIISDDQALADICIDLQLQEAIALDTEFIRTRTYYPKLALLQIGTADHTWLIDPLAIEDASPLVALLRNPQVCKVVHACSEDLEALQHRYDCVPQNLIDTQIAAAFAGEGWGMGYQRLVETLLDISLEKGETRSDWLQRPLDEKQLTYAAADVAYLLPCFTKLKHRMEELQRWSWCVDYCEQMLRDSFNPDADRQYFQRIKSAWQLDRQQLQVLQVLAQWREQTARAKDVPRGYIVEDASLLAMAKNLPVGMPELSALPKLHPKTVRRYGEHLLDLITQARNRPKNEWPESMPRPLPVKSSKKSKVLRAVIKRIAQRENIAMELLIRKSDLSFILRQQFKSKSRPGTQILPADWPQWRLELVGDAILQCLEEISEP